MRVLVTGGTGYIGAHVVDLLGGGGHDVLIADDVATGRRERVAGVPLTQLDLATDGARHVLTELLSGGTATPRVDAVIHFAARKRVDESVARPAWYLHQNVAGLANLLLAMERAAVDRLVFSSSAAVYGESHGASLDEETPTTPMNAYGDSKLMGERLITRCADAWGLRATSLRYFNVAGARRPELGDREALNLIPIVLAALAQGRSPVIFGDDYDTPDGTCIRDYVHVSDLAEVHLRALSALHESRPGHAVYNVGTGKGTSVREVVTLAQQVTGSTVEPTVTDRRTGDPAAVVASCQRIADDLGWRARLDVREAISSSWAAMQHSAGRTAPPV